MLSAWVQILIFVAAAVIVNGIIYLIGWKNMYRGCRGKLIPPGWIIAIIWTVLFGFFGYAHYLVFKKNNQRWTVANIAIIVVAVFCLSYTWIIYMFPAFTKFMNVLSLIVAFVLGILVFNENEEAFWWLLPFIAWSAYVNLAESLILCKSVSKTLGYDNILFTTC
jgi:tryptophan-rich sensory protein